jgi:hypothetical protein
MPGLFKGTGVRAFRWFEQEARRMGTSGLFLREEWSVPKTQELREYAAQCLRLADEHPDERDLWIGLAERWNALADKLAEDEPPEPADSGF